MHPRRLTPSMSLLVAFEAAARHLSFTRAADELSLTQSAISRQVAALEALLEVTLFRRCSGIYAPGLKLQFCLIRVSKQSGENRH